MRNYNPSFTHLINYISNLPYLYRYENKKYIDDFFENGNLMISSFQNYRHYEDNELGDATEGSSMNIGKGSKGKDFMSITTVGANDYTFCTSTICDSKLMKKFSRNSVFRIVDPINFILEITRSLPRVHNVIHGNCIYLPERTITKNLKNIDVEKIGNSLEKMMQISAEVQGLDPYFLKKKKYQEQSEYRIIWQTDRIVNGSMVISCPEAIKFCERIDLAEL